MTKKEIMKDIDPAVDAILANTDNPIVDKSALKSLILVAINESLSSYLLHAADEAMPEKDKLKTKDCRCWIDEEEVQICEPCYVARESNAAIDAYRANLRRMAGEDL